MSNARAKRWAEWTTVFSREKPRSRRDALHNTASYREDGWKDARTVRIVEVKRGEVVVDARALMDEFSVQGGWGTVALERALKKVGVR